MRRLFFLAPDVSSAHALVDSLLLARITDKHIHVLAREGTPLGDLPEAGVAQRSDLIPALERGAAAGGATGLVAGLVIGLNRPVCARIGFLRKIVVFV